MSCDERYCIVMPATLIDYHQDTAENFGALQSVTT